MDNEISIFLEYALDKEVNNRPCVSGKEESEYEIAFAMWRSKINLLEELIYDAKHM